PRDQYTQTRQYPQGPQGDPFAPQPVATYFPIPAQELPPPPKQLKRKRKPRREEECGFCQGNDEKNKDGEPEVMVSCDECGRSGHPSCMNLAEIGNVVRQYPWKCTECKNCEICQLKSDDDRILFCDFCDRGWHMYCMSPPIEEAPTGKWHCPQCPPLFPEPPVSHPSPNSYIPQAEDPQFIKPVRGSSVISSSSSVASGAAYKGKGKAAVVVVSTDDSESESDDMDVDAMSAILRPRPPPKKQKKSKTRSSKQHSSTVYEAPIESPAPSTKRMKLRLSSPTIPKVRLRLPAQKSRRKEHEEDDPPKGMFDDILSPEDRDISKTSIREPDKQLFERSRMLSETRLAPPVPPPQSTSQASEAPEVPHAGPSRPLRSTTSSQHAPPPTLTIDTSTSPTPTTPLAASDPCSLRIRAIRFGDYDIQTWYDAPFPEEYATIPDGRLWICEFCLKYMKSKFGALKCKARHPPGDEIYRDGNISIFEVDGRKNKIYCQNLCLLSKMFLDHKSLFYDVEPFLFYVITEVDEIGARFVGYFSKEKRSPKDYNVSCIMTLPVRQRQGWGNLLIDFSYLLSKKEKRVGSPEKPLSALGALGYKKYWTLTVMRYLQTAPDRPTLEDISSATSMTIEDVYNTLVQQNMISYRPPTPPPIKPSPGQSIKFPKGRKNGIARKHLQRTLTNDSTHDTSNGPFVAPKHYEIHWDRDQVEEYLDTWEAKQYVKLRPEKLQWTPYLLTHKADSLDAVDTPIATHYESTSPNGASTIDDQASGVPFKLHRRVSEGVDEESQTFVRQTRSKSRSPIKRAVQVDTPKRLLRSNSNQMLPFTLMESHKDEASLSINSGVSTRGRSTSQRLDVVDAEEQLQRNVRHIARNPDTPRRVESTMQYGHMPMPERRDSNLDSNGSTPFQTHQSLGQALGTHLPGAVGPGPASYNRGTDNYRNLSTSPPSLPPSAATSQTHPGASSSHSPLFAVTGQASPGVKRKQIDGVLSSQVIKRRRDNDDSADFDLDSAGQGAKHWTDEEKSKLFNWLMGQGQDEHWNALRATKNSCLRECSVEVFGSKKTYQALKGCYERNFNLFKQIYAFESFHPHGGSASIQNLPEADRLREYERRLQAARKAGCDVGNITARTIDHWHRVGWYQLFYRRQVPSQASYSLGCDLDLMMFFFFSDMSARWHGDPATTRPIQSRANGQGPPTSGTVDDGDADEDQQPIDFPSNDPIQVSNGINGIPSERSHPTTTFINPQNLRDIPPLPNSPPAAAGGPAPPNGTPTSLANDQTVVHIPITQGMLHTYLQFLQVQTQTGKMKLEYMRRREEREERESAQRREVERLKMEREAAEFEHNKQTANTKQKADRAIELLGNPIVDASVKQAAGDYLKKLFTVD
ncbi:hypothetical protein AMATHDRAFT_138384, partial [Amanita thiersii Skay4041]